MKVKCFYEPNFREWKENDNIYPPLRSAGGTMGNGSEGIIVTYQKVTGTLSPGAHCGSYNGQDASNDMLIVEGDRDKVLFDTEDRRIQGIEGSTHIKCEGLQECDRPDIRGGTAMNEEKTKSIVRRLTPTECERLQGFPDGWTDLGDWIDENGKVHKYADTPRYKALGNSIALPFWQYLARRIVAQYEHEVTMGSLFSGIGGFELVFSRCGAEPLWSSEIEPFCNAVLREHFPEGEPMTVGGLIEIIDDNANVKIVLSETDKTIAEYDGRNSIPKSLNPCPAQKIRCKDGCIIIEI